MRLLATTLTALGVAVGFGAVCAGTAWAQASEAVEHTCRDLNLSPTGMSDCEQQMENATNDADRARVLHTFAMGLVASQGPAPPVAAEPAGPSGVTPKPAAQTETMSEPAASEPATPAAQAGTVEGTTTTRATTPKKNTGPAATAKAR